jgi:hypothetical protein
MPLENSLKKKPTQQTISITPKLKERVDNYVKDHQKKDPNDKRFKSVSALYTYVMETVLDCFDKGKSLEDLEHLADSEFKNFYERLSFNAVIPYYEEAIKTNRYSNPTLEKVTFFFLTIRRFYMGIMDPTDTSSIQNLINRIKNYLVSNNLTKEFKIDLFTGKSKTDLTATFEFVGLYKNLGYETCKYTAAFFGLLGIRVTDCVYSFKDVYYRFDLKATDLFYTKELAKSERIKLMNYNITYFLNYNRVINDKDYYLWMKMAEDKNIIVSFNNEEAQGEWTSLIEQEISKYSEKEDHLYHILKYFERLHWIELIGDTELIFQIRLSETKYKYERDYLLKILSKYSDISELEGNFYLNKPRS